MKDDWWLEFDGNCLFYTNWDVPWVAVARLGDITMFTLHPPMIPPISLLSFEIAFGVYTIEANPILFLYSILSLLISRESHLLYVVSPVLA